VATFGGVAVTETSRTRTRRWPIAVAVAAVILLVLELGARALAPYLPEPKLWGDDATTVKVAQMDARASACTDLVLAGNSMGRDAFDPQTFAAADPAHRSAYNASLDAASPELLERWVTEEVVPRLHPRTVVLTLASLDVNDHSLAGQSAVRAYDDAVLSRPGVLGKVEATAAQKSALVRYRADLRQPGEVWDAIGRARDGTQADRLSADGIAGVLGADGQGLSRRTLHYSGSSVTKAFLTGQLLNDYAVGDAQLAAEGRLIDTLRNEGIAVALVLPPVTDDYRNLHPGGPAEVDRFVATARGLADQHHAAFVDLTRTAPVEQFADTHHLNGAGADAFSRALPDRLAQAGLPVTGCQ
jgi:hypothetical protein